MNGKAIHMVLAVLFSLSVAESMPSEISQEIVPPSESRPVVRVLTDKQFVICNGCRPVLKLTKMPEHQNSGVVLTFGMPEPAAQEIYDK